MGHAIGSDGSTSLSLYGLTSDPLGMGVNPKPQEG